MQNKYPIYVISKGRYQSRLTSKALERMNAPYRIVVEPQEYDLYAAVIDPEKILITPFSNLGQGSIPVRNWVWEHSIQEGHKRHWILDDNIRCFYRMHRNKKYRVNTTAVFRSAEDFVDRYENVAIAGFEYSMFRPAREKSAPIAINRRVYSCMLIDNSIDFRWRGRYNEDTDLCIRVMKAGYCTILFYAFQAAKMASMVMKGGNTTELYANTNNRLEFARSLQQQHPDLVKIVWRYGRWHHHVDYRPFRGNKLIRKKNIEIPTGIDNYGMKLVEADK